jgi:hypothetical protein
MDEEVECKGTRVENLSPPLDDRSRPCTLMGAEGLARIICIDSLNNHDNLKFMFMRSLRLPKSGVETFFLWGPRQTGKTTLLKGGVPRRFVD